METLILNQSCDVKPVLTKADFVRRYKQGEFGNHAPTWDNILEWTKDRRWCRKKGQLYHIRNRLIGEKTWYNVPDHLVSDTWLTAAIEYGQQNIYISAMAPTHLTLLQGEVQRSIRFLDLLYTRIRKPMREALDAESYSVSGVSAVLLLKSYMDANSYEWLEHLLDVYEEHIVEFSCYEKQWGTVLGYNVVFWEVRKY